MDDSLLWLGMSSDLEAGRVCMLVTQSCLTLTTIPYPTHMDCCLPVSSLHDISQARILVWVAIPFSMETPTQGLNMDLLYCRQIVYYLSHQGSCWRLEVFFKVHSCFGKSIVVMVVELKSLFPFWMSAGTTVGS